MAVDVYRYLLAYLAGFATPFVWFWLDWTLGKRRHNDWGEWE